MSGVVGCGDETAEKEKEVRLGENAGELLVENLLSACFCCVFCQKLYPPITFSDL